MNTKIRLIQLGKKQTDLLEELHKRGYRTVNAGCLSRAINNKSIEPLAQRVREMVEDILTEWEAEQEAQ